MSERMHERKGEREREREREIGKIGRASDTKYVSEEKGIKDVCLQVHSIHVSVWSCKEWACAVLCCVASSHVFVCNEYLKVPPS